MNDQEPIGFTFSNDYEFLLGVGKSGCIHVWKTENTEQEHFSLKLPAELRGVVKVE